MAEDKRPGAKSPKAEKKAAKAEKAAQPAAAPVADQPHQPARLKGAIATDRAGADEAVRLQVA